MENHSLLDLIEFQKSTRHDSIMKQLNGKLERDIDPTINDEELEELLIAVGYYDSYTAIHSLEVAALCFHIGKHIVKEHELEVLNALRHHCMEQPNQTIVLRKIGLCSTPYGITAWNSLAGL